MTRVSLVIGNKNYSSWSLRPWLLLRHFGIAFDEIRIALFTEGYQDELRRYSPTLKVPVLIDEELTVWESMAICEYVNEQYLQDRALPAGREARALCRSVCLEMHAGFAAIRQQLPMNCRALRKLKPSPEVRQEIARVDSLWTRTRRRFVDRGEYLFGSFSLADCMYAPMVLRFHTYGIEPGRHASTYMQTMLDNEAMQAWIADAEKEEQHLSDYEVGTERQRKPTKE